MNLVVGIFIIIILVILLAGLQTSNKMHQLKRYEKITINMPEEEMLSIMGTGYDKSLLKNNRVKYEWRINASSYGNNSGSFSTRTYSGVKKVTIYVKNGRVEEVKPYNVH